MLLTHAKHPRNRGLAVAAPTGRSALVGQSADRGVDVAPAGERDEDPLVPARRDPDAPASDPPAHVKQLGLRYARPASALAFSISLVNTRSHAFLPFAEIRDV